jgi:hypothetical protein
VIATDPISDNRPARACSGDQENHLGADPLCDLQPPPPDHRRRQAFKDAGAIFVAHRLARERLTAMARPDIVIPDEIMDDRRTISLGGTELELLYVGGTIRTIRWSCDC